MDQDFISINIVIDAAERALSDHFKRKWLTISMKLRPLIT